MDKTSAVAKEATQAESQMSRIYDALTACENRTHGIKCRVIADQPTSETPSSDSGLVGQLEVVANRIEALVGDLGEISKAV